MQEQDKGDIWAMVDKGVEYVPSQMLVRCSR